MNGKELLEKMELIDPQYIEEADRQPRKKPLMLPHWFAMAACLTLSAAVATAAVLFPTDSIIEVSPSGDAASIFGSGQICLVISLVLLAAAGGIFAYIMKKRKK